MICHDKETCFKSVQYFIQQKESEDSTVTPGAHLSVLPPYRCLKKDGPKLRPDVENNSPRTIKPTFCSYQKQSFIGMKQRNVCTKNLLEEEGDPVGPSTKQSITKVLNISKDFSVSILNCRVLKV